jgi:hypothetical protein
VWIVVNEPIGRRDSDRRHHDTTDDGECGVCGGTD